MTIRFGDRPERAVSVESSPAIALRVAGSQRINMLEFEAWDITMVANCTLTPINPMPGRLVAATIHVEGSFTLTWGGTIRWTNGTIPTYTTPATYVIWTMRGETGVFRGRQIGKGFA